MSEPKYAALIKKSVWIPGDERSRTHPGHGYPEHSEEYTEVLEFKSKADMEAWVQRQVTTRYGSETYRLIEYRELKVEVTTAVKLT